MFGIKIISESKYQSELATARKLIEINEELTKKNTKLELDIKDLREQNSHLRTINAKRKEENDNLAIKNTKQKEVLKEHEAFRRAIRNAFPQIDFKGYRPQPCDKKCSECPLAESDCKKYTDLSLCMVPSFRK